MKKYKIKYLKKMNNHYKKEKENQYFSRAVCLQVKKSMDYANLLNALNIKKTYTK